MGIKICAHVLSTFGVQMMCAFAWSFVNLGLLCANIVFADVKPYFSDGVMCLYCTRSQTRVKWDQEYAVICYIFNYSSSEIYIYWLVLSGYQK